MKALYTAKADNPGHSEVTYSKTERLCLCPIIHIFLGTLWKVRSWLDGADEIHRDKIKNVISPKILHFRPSECHLIFASVPFL